MKTLYFDCFAGASGDMILGALIACGADREDLVRQLKTLAIADFEIEFESVTRSGIAAQQARIRTAEQHAHRNLHDITDIINRSQLSDKTRALAIKIFTRLAHAEARVHSESIEQIHFHEVGAMDAILDVAGACILFEQLGIEQFASSALHVGSGTVTMAHGRFPVPPPAVVELTHHVPIYATDIKGELLTPTGAAIITTVCETFGSLPPMRVETSGYGAGNRQYADFPNALRVMIGNREDLSNAGLSLRHQTSNLPVTLNESAHENRRDDKNLLTENLVLLETNIDDATPQLIGYVMDKALRTGALDCFVTPIQMKKNRPAVLLSILCETEKLAVMRELIFSETPSLGIRETLVTRRSLPRRVVRVTTAYGAINIKVGGTAKRETSEIAAPSTEAMSHSTDDLQNSRSYETFTPEYDDVARCAARHHVSWREVEQAARTAYIEQHGQH